MLDTTPDVEGFDAIYGISAHTCPYCDGWEHARPAPRGLRAGRSPAAHMGAAAAPVVARRDGLQQRGRAEDEAALDELGVEVVSEPVERFVHTDGQLTAIELAGREPIERDALFFHVAMEPRSALAATLGCALEESGFVTAAPDDRQTSVDRVYAAGNCADPMQNVVDGDRRRRPRRRRGQRAARRRGRRAAPPTIASQ